MESGSSNAGAGGHKEGNAAKPTQQQQQPNKKPAGKKDVTKPQASKAVPTAPGSDAGQQMLDNLVTNMRTMVTDPSMFAILNGIDDSIMSSGQTTVIHCTVDKDVDYIVIPL